MTRGIKNSSKRVSGRGNNSIEYVTTSYSANTESNISEVEVLLTSNIAFTYGSNSYLNKEKITFKVEYKNSKCNILSTSFFEKVLQDQKDDAQGKSFVSMILLVVFGVIFLIIVGLVFLFLKLISKKVEGKV